MIVVKMLVLLVLASTSCFEGMAGAVVLVVLVVALTIGSLIDFALYS